MNPDAKVFIDDIEAVKKRAAEYAGFINKLKVRLSRAEKALAEKPVVASVVSTLIADLQRMSPEPDRLAVSQLIQSLDQRLQPARQRLADSFPADLQQHCEAAHLQFSVVPDGFGVGPFLVIVTFPKETASFHYAKVILATDIPLDAKAIVDEAIAQKALLLDQPIDTVRFANDLYEAMRVASVRQNRTQKVELRVELPLLFREMQWIRQSPSTGTKHKPAKNEYSLPRFIVELKQFVQSDQNTRSDRPFRPEPAVIENAKNPKMSLFIPKDVFCGFGEGIYCQAVVVRQE